MTLNTIFSGVGSHTKREVGYGLKIQLRIDRSHFKMVIHESCRLVIDEEFSVKFLTFKLITYMLK